MHRRTYGMICLFAITCPTILFAQGDDMSLEAIEQQYSELRRVPLNPQTVVEVNGLVISKDVASFELTSGHLYFFRSIADRRVGGYFEGEGMFRLSAEDEIEKGQLVRFSGEGALSIEFQQALFFFTDSTYEMIAAVEEIGARDLPDSTLQAYDSFRQKIRERFEWNFDARIICDLAAARFGGFFCSAIECLDGKDMLYIVDPFDDEGVTLLNYEKIRGSKRAYFEYWYSSRASSPFSIESPSFDIESTDMDITINGRNEISVRADMEFLCSVEGVRITALELVPLMRVELAVLDDMDTCFVIQEDAKANGQIWLVFPETIAKDREYKLSIVYAGGGIVEDLGGDNFAVMARTSWFPSFYTNAFDPRRFTMTFAVSSKMTLLASGKFVDSWSEGDVNYTKWDSGEEYDFAGFNYGKFSAVTEMSDKCRIECYTNVKLSDGLLRVRRLLEEYKDLQSILMILPHELTTDRIGRNAAIDSRNAYEIFNHFFGEIPIQEIRVSQQPDISFAQSWPTLIYLPFTAFWDESVRERLGLIRGDASVLGYETVASHELAHQWWGNTVMRDSYHDEWLMEGFATYSSALCLQATSGTNRFKDYMNIQRRLILSRSYGDLTYNDLGPIWLGLRLSSLDFPEGRRLMYAKGAYVLHMLRMMLFDYDKKSDERFIGMMKDYVRTHAGKIVTTHDFKRIVEKHFRREMDWFFDQWVFGTDVPVYKFNYEIKEGDDGYILTLYIQQSNVSPLFEMPVPFVVNFDDGHAVVHLTVKGNAAIGKQFHLPKEPKTIEANPWNAVLCNMVR